MNQFSIPGEDVRNEHVALGRIQRAEMVRAFIISARVSWDGLDHEDGLKSKVQSSRSQIQGPGSNKQFRVQASACEQVVQSTSFSLRTSSSEYKLQLACSHWSNLKVIL